MNLSFIWKAGKVLDADAGYCPAAREGDKCMNASTSFKVPCEEKASEEMGMYIAIPIGHCTHMTLMINSDRHT